MSSPSEVTDISKEEWLAWCSDHYDRAVMAHAAALFVSSVISENRGDIRRHGSSGSMACIGAVDDLFSPLIVGCLTQELVDAVDGCMDNGNSEGDPTGPPTAEA